MERLTFDNSKGNGVLHASVVAGCEKNQALTCDTLCRDYSKKNGNSCKGCPIQAAYDSLAAYERTALTPTDITALQAENQRLEETIHRMHEQAQMDAVHSVALFDGQTKQMQAELSALKGKIERGEMVQLTYALGTPLFEEWPKGSGEIIPFFVIGQVDSSIITCNQGLKDVLLIGTDEVNLTEESARAALNPHA